MLFHFNAMFPPKIVGYVLSQQEKNAQGAFQLDALLKYVLSFRVHY